MIKSKKQSLIVIGVFTLVLALVTTTYAFFNYNRTGSANTIRTGRIYFSTEQTNNNTINLTNIFPMTKEQALADSSTNGTLVVTFTGDTTYTDGIEYLLTLENVTRASNVPVSLIMDVNVTSRTAGETPTTTTITENANYYTARDAKNASMYIATGENTTINSTTHKVITDISSGQYLLAGYIKSGTDVVNGTVTIKAFIDADNIIITDTPDDQSQRPSTAYTDGTDTTGKTVISTTDWNTLQANGIRFQVKGEARPGIWVENPVKPTLYEIMQNANQGIISNFSQNSQQDGTSGVYETTEGTTPIYYYRGAVDNNVKFGDYCWKAVRTTITGGVKLIYNGEAVGNQCTTQTGNGTMINRVSNIAFNISENDAKYVGYTYDVNGNETDSKMKQVIDLWYTSAVANNKIDDTKIETTTYCNDRSVASTNGSRIYYGAYGRLITNKAPSLNCPNVGDSYSLKAGFLTADEIVYAGGSASFNYSFYLYNSADYWSGSPVSFGSYSSVFAMNGSSLDYAGITINKGVRSVVSIKPGTTVTSGDGTPTNPYIVS